MKPARKPPNKGRNGPGVMGRPRVDQELLARAVAMVEAGSHTCEEAGEEIGRLTGTRLGGNTVRRAVKAKEAAAEGVIVEAGEPSAELVVMTGIPASGKSTIARSFAEHVRVNRDEAGGSVAALAGQVEAHLVAGRSVVLDVTAPTVADRAPWVALARRCGVRVVSMFVESSKEGALSRNALREGAARVPDAAIYAVAARLEHPSAEEGFDELRRASIESGAALSADLVDDVLSPADPERAAAIRSLVVRGTLPGTNAKGEQVELPVDFGPDWIARVAEGEGITAGEVRRLLREAAVQARLDALPFELARERSIAVADGAGQMAKDAHDWKSLLLAQAHVDRLRFLATPPDPEGLTRAEVTILLRRVAAELQEVAGGVEALQRALAGA